MTLEHVLATIGAFVLVAIVIVAIIMTVDHWGKL